MIACIHESDCLFCPPRFAHHRLDLYSPTRGRSVNCIDIAAAKATEPDVSRTPQELRHSDL